MIVLGKSLKKTDYNREGQSTKLAGHVISDYPGRPNNDGGNFDIYDTLDDLELKSLWKSNKFTKIERQMHRFYYVSRTIREVIPVMAALGATVVILDAITRATQKRSEK